jgi:hypothetical protein
MIQDGDLSVLGSECQIVSGIDKLRQDLTLWLTIRVGSNRFHPTFGSALESYIGSIITPGTQANVYNEVLRVLTNYQSMVYQLFTANPNIFSLSELPYSIDAINVGINYDTVSATVQVSNPTSTTQVSVSPTSL